MTKLVNNASFLPASYEIDRKHDENNIVLQHNLHNTIFLKSMYQANEVVIVGNGLSYTDSIGQPSYSMEEVV